MSHPRLTGRTLAQRRNYMEDGRYPGIPCVASCVATWSGTDIAVKRPKVADRIDATIQIRSRARAAGLSSEMLLFLDRNKGRTY